MGYNMVVSQPGWRRRPTKKPNDDVITPWQPDTGTLEDFHKYHGMDPETAIKQKENVMTYKQLIAERHGFQLAPEDLTEFIGDTLPTLEQIQDSLQKQEHKEKRVKRKIISPVDSRWTGTISFRFDGTQSAADVAIIRRAVDVWRQATCLEFQELSNTTGYNGQYILFTSTAGCWAYVGQIRSPKPQIINLQSPGCTTLVGTVIHEIGHAMGFVHEHVRPDRDSFVKIFLDNVKSDSVANFEIKDSSEVIDYGVPYDYGSVMHYNTRSLSKDQRQLDTVVPLDPIQRNTIGQRLELSFLDAKLANLAYCSDRCSGIPAPSCQHGGYQDPLDCNICRCPDAYGGTLCDTLADSSSDCGVTSQPLRAGDSEVCIESPNFATGVLNPGTQCNWKVEAPSGCTVDFQFTALSLVCNKRAIDDATCLHWVELKDDKKGEETGTRFCCQTVPETPYTSSSNETIVTLRTLYEQVTSGQFRLCYKLTVPECDDVITTPPTTTTTQVTTTTTTPVTTTTTTTSTTRTVPTTSITPVRSTTFRTDTPPSTTQRTTARPVTPRRTRPPRTRPPRTRPTWTVQTTRTRRTVLPRTTPPRTTISPDLSCHSWNSWRSRTCIRYWLRRISQYFGYRN